jgi:hypothetical protein
MSLSPLLTPSGEAIPKRTSKPERTAVTAPNTHSPNTTTSKQVAAPSAAPREASRLFATADGQTITAQDIEGVRYYSTTRRGVDYTAYTIRGEWICLTKRLALGRMNPGGCKYFKTIAELGQAVKAFSNLSQLIEG